ncbi:citryl-CoA lyase [Halosimplex carlsbadense 2-9-1]|uniref:Citryl-CoA lyase n=1 Tax=Halosimplex carlsbadense 2-9-1 TaxID=797114 RepID=M0CK89_9EURY|nr:CoA ester lyase [Halosimplex carlsbadense]ELZ22787.1 citryl-CoA lyase [Halosimplex carlsbadense 2-9-1]
MVRRSVLFSPGDRPELLRKAPTTGADTVVFDLEDAVAPGRRAEAGATVARVLADLDADCEVCVRVRPPGWGAADDLQAVLGGDARSGLDALVLPKAESADDVTDLAGLAAERDADRPILALVETAAGVLHAEEIAAVDVTDALIFGAEDLAADIGATRSEAGTEVLHAREHVVLAAAAAGVDAVDTLYTDFEDEGGLRDDTEFARELGYDGKLAIHPSQVGPINETFTPDPERVEWAERVLAAKSDADADDRGVFAVDGEMVDAPLVAQAERVLERARAADARE